MKYRVGIVILSALILLACGFSFDGARAPTVQVPPTPSQGGITIPIDHTLPDVRVGASGTSCSALAADLHGQSVSGTLTIFPHATPNELRAVTNNGNYAGNATLLNGNCQSTGQQYNLTATFGLDYTATLGNVGNDRCIQQSNLVVTSLNLQGLPGPLGALAQPLVMSEMPRLLTPPIDEVVARQINGGRMPSSGAHCPGS